MGLEVAQALDPETLAVGLAHRQRITVDEAQRHGHAQPLFGQLGAHGRQIGGFGVLEDLGVDGAQVLRVDVDRARLERLVHHGGVAQALAVFRGAMQPGGLRDDLAEDVRLGEALGAHLERRTLCGRAGSEHDGEGSDQQADECEFHAASCQGFCLQQLHGVSHSNNTSCAPCHSTVRPSSGRCSRPSTTRRKWLPASGPILLAKLQAP